MVSDATTFFLSFAAVFGGLAYYLLRLDLEVRDLERRLAATGPAPAPAAPLGEPEQGDVT